MISCGHSVEPDRKSSHRGNEITCIVSCCAAWNKKMFPSPCRIEADCCVFDIAYGRHEYECGNSAVMSNYKRVVLRRNSVSAAFLLSATIQHENKYKLQPALVRTSNTFLRQC